MTELEKKRNKAFKEKLMQLLAVVRELDEIADTFVPNEISYLRVTFGKHGTLSREIKGFCKSLGVKTDF